VVGNAVVHRLVEQQAAVQAGKLAIVDERRGLTYRELNFRANATARALLAGGFKRGALAVVRMPPSADLLIALLAVLKAGGRYMCVDPRDASWPPGISVADRADRDEHRFVSIDVARVLAEDAWPSPNLPILTRGSDAACSTPDGTLVPHSTIAALRQHYVAGDVTWYPEGTEIDAWVALMTGVTVRLTAAPSTAAA
jgi:non-ribosomal peptide synthetase component F